MQRRQAETLLYLFEMNRIKQEEMRARKEARLKNQTRSLDIVPMLKENKEN
jgi:hypothetical protein